MRRSEGIGMAVLGLLVTVVPRASAQEGTITGVVVEVKDQGGVGRQGITETLLTSGGNTSLGPTGSDSLTVGGSTWALRTSGDREPPAQVGGSRLGRFRVGLSLDLAYYWDFEDVVGSQPAIADYSSNELTYGVGASLEWSPIDRLMLGVGVHYNPHTFEQQFDSPDPLSPTRVSGTVRSWMVDAYLGPRFQVGPVGLAFPLGLTWADDSARLREEFVDDVQKKINRDLQMLKGHTGVMLDVPMSSTLSARTDVDVTSSFKHPDADANVRVRFGVWFQF